MDRPSLSPDRRFHSRSRRIASLCIAAFCLAAAGGIRAAAFEPDEAITSINVKVHTADVDLAGTDDDVYVELFDWPPGVPNPGGVWAVEIDSSADDFERNSTRTYSLPAWFFQGRIVNDTRRVCIHKSSDGAWGGWALGYVTVTVNGKELFTSYNPNNPGDYRWLEDDGRSWCGGYQPIEFVAPVIQTLGLPDSGSSQNYSVTLVAKGGRKPLTWQLTASSSGAFATGPTLAPIVADGTQARFTGKTVLATTAVPWSGSIRLRDADGRTTTRAFSMKVTDTLLPPVVTSFTPTFGWPARPPSTPNAVEVVVSGANFDSRKAGATKVFFGSVQAPVLEATGSQLKVRVPSGAIPGRIKAQTAFGQATSSQVFTAHPNGFRFLSGFPFQNGDGMPGEFAWERYEQAFGVCDMWLCVAGTATVPDPVGGLLYEVTKSAISNGVCHGMSLTSLQLRQGILPASAYDKSGNAYPLSETLWDFAGVGGPSSGLSKTVQSRQIVTYSDEALSYYFDRIDSIPTVSGNSDMMDARTALNDMNAALGNNLNDPRMIAFARNDDPFEAHVVVPYLVEPGGSASTSSIRVWDSNRPATTTSVSDENSVFSVDKTTGAWGYEWGSGEIWDGMLMFTIPLSRYGHQEDWSLPGLTTLLDGVMIYLGYAGTDGNGSLVQVADAGGRTLFGADGNLKANRADWPKGIRPVPIFGVGGTKPRMVTLTEPVRATFTIRPRVVFRPIGTPAPDPALFAFLQGNAGGVSVEEVTAPLTLDVDSADRSLRIAPVTGETSAIVRFAQRLPDSTETLSYAVRASNMRAQNPLKLRPEAGGKGVSVAASGAAIDFDVEVIHTDRIGQTRILQRDGLQLPARGKAVFDVPDVSLMGTANAMPLRMMLDADGTGASIVRQDLGERLNGPKLDLPVHVLTATSAAGVDVTIDAARTLNPNPTSALRFRAYDGFSLSTPQANRLVLTAMQPGTRPVRIISEDSAGRKSFPRTVFVTVPEGDRRDFSPLKIVAEDVTILPGETKPAPLSAYLPELSASRIEASLDLRRRYSGFAVGRGRPMFAPNATLVLSRAMKERRANVTATFSSDRRTVNLVIAWDPLKPLSGRFDLGSIAVAVPETMTLGEAFLLSGEGKASNRLALAGVSHPMSVVPGIIKVWGGNEPATLAVEGPNSVTEDSEITLKAAATGLRSLTDTPGWWFEGLGGRVQLLPVKGDPSQARVLGVRAGFVKIHVVAGTTEATKVLKVTPRVRLSLSALPVLREASRYPLSRGILLSDLNGDEKTTILDATMALRAAVGLITLKGDALEAGDVNGDGKINVLDALRVLRIVAGLEKVDEYGTIVPVAADRPIEVIPSLPIVVIPNLPIDVSPIKPIEVSPIKPIAIGSGG